MAGASPAITIHGPAKQLRGIVVRPLAGLMPFDLVCTNVNYAPGNRLELQAKKPSTVLKKLG